MTPAAARGARHNMIQVLGMHRGGTSAAAGMQRMRPLGRLNPPRFALLMAAWVPGTGQPKFRPWWTRDLEH